MPSPRKSVVEQKETATGNDSELHTSVADVRKLESPWLSKALERKDRIRR